MVGSCLGFRYQRKRHEGRNVKVQKSVPAFTRVSEHNIRRGCAGLVSQKVKVLFRGVERPAGRSRPRRGAGGGVGGLLYKSIVSAQDAPNTNIAFREEEPQSVLTPQPAGVRICG
ncbi:hypothetical protein E2C01_034034 [Portunus trituberculatus]|uniref:Uncharacterized protein n=1 Tax=Portunus trituberculatus TaxID=210409 RepID=A0A5B7F7E5_PORTR|nr:hypothetical protein [Portunus trituberculatus]